MDNDNDVMMGIQNTTIAVTNTCAAALSLGIKKVEWRTFHIGNDKHDLNKYVCFHRSSTKVPIPTMTACVYTDYTCIQ